MSERRPQWTATVPADDIPTPAHARTVWPDERADEADAVGEEAPAASKPWTKALMASVVVGMVFVLMMVMFMYDSDHFAPITITGTAGVTVLSFFIFWDIWNANTEI